MKVDKFPIKNPMVGREDYMVTTFLFHVCKDGRAGRSGTKNVSAIKPTTYHKERPSDI